jgi:hypothetical protein
MAALRHKARCSALNYQMRIPVIVNTDSGRP